ncbi:hypothetical protein BE61_15420 [Bradyrhizobium elkanii USDA 61]|nr:hypothetical protein BE61_15420 [Bradyrhizobium elkanii USDA 61]GEC57199.1 hypothetical protein BEL01nite_62420 [Bradyrhizobium elkanii]
MMFSITGVTPSCSVCSHGAGCPISAKADPAATDATPATANPSNCLPNRPIDIFMPLALPCIIPQSTPGMWPKMQHDPP